MVREAVGKPKDYRGNFDAGLGAAEEMLQQVYMMNTINCCSEIPGKFGYYNF